MFWQIIWKLTVCISSYLHECRCSVLFHMMKPLECSRENLFLHQFISSLPDRSPTKELLLHETGTSYGTFCLWMCHWPPIQTAGTSWKQTMYVHHVNIHQCTCTHTLHYTFTTSGSLERTQVIWQQALLWQWVHEGNWAGKGSQHGRPFLSPL